MALPQIGLQAIIAGLPGFNAGAQAIINAYNSIESRGQNVARASNILGSSISSLASPFVSIGQSVLNFGTILGGAALVGVTALTAGVVALGTMALGEIAKYERMELSIQNLVAREISQGQVVEQQIQTRIQLTAQETAELEKLKGGLDNEINGRDILTARIEEQKQRIIDLTAQYGENGLVVIKERAELQGMQLDLDDLNGKISTHTGRIDELTSKNGQLTTTLQKVRVGQMDMSEAMELASPRAQELIKWIQMLAIQSPFNSEDIQNAFQTALAYGFTTEEAQRLTAAEVDFTAATGKSAQAADLIALALGQIQARGKLSAQELNQLSSSGIGTSAILEKLGFTLNDVSNGLVPVDQFIEAVIQDMEVFKGAAKDQASTFSGLISSLNEIKSIALREFFTGTFKAIQPYLATFVDFLTEASLKTGSIKEMGNAIGQVVGGGLKKVAGWIRIISELGAGGGLAILNEIFGPAAFALWRELTDLVNNISLSFSGVGESLSGLMPSFSELSAIILPAITTALAFVNDHFEEFKGALMGIGGVLAVGVFTAITAGILSLLTPVNLIIAGAALLGAAWAGNWGGIQEKTLGVWGVVQPVLQQIYDWLAINIPIAVQIAGDFWTNTLQPAVVQVSNWIKSTLIPTLADLWNWLYTNIPIAVQALSDIWTNTLLPGFTRVWEAVQTNLLPLFVQLVDWLGIQTPGATQVLADFWTNTLLPALVTVSDFLLNTLFPIWVETGVWLAENIPVAIQTLSNMWTNTLLPALTAVGNYISQVSLPFWEAIGNVISAVVNKAVEAGAGLWQNVLYPTLTNVGNYLSDTLSPVFTELGEWLNNTFGPTVQTLGNDFLPTITTAFEGIVGAVQTTTQWLNDLATNINSLQLPAWLTPGSPTPFELGLTGIATALSSLLLPAFTSTFATLVSTVNTFVTETWTTFINSISSIYTLYIPTLLTQFTVLFSTLTANLTTLTTGALTEFITVLSTIYMVHLPTLSTIFLTSVSTITEQLITLTTGALTNFINTLSTIYTTYLPTLVRVWTSSTASIASLISTTINKLGNLMTKLSETQTAGTTMADVIVDGLSSVISKIGSAISKINSLIDAVKEATKEFEKMEAAARRAAEAAGSAGNNASSAGVTGFQHGVTNFTVPSGYPNDSYRIGLTSGEVVNVIPHAQANTTSSQNVTNYNFAMTVSSLASPQAVIQQFQVMRAMA